MLYTYQHQVFNKLSWQGQGHSVRSAFKFLDLHPRSSCGSHGIFEITSAVEEILPYIPKLNAKLTLLWQILGYTIYFLPHTVDTIDPVFPSVELTDSVAEIYALLHPYAIGLAATARGDGDQESVKVLIKLL